MKHLFVKLLAGALALGTVTAPALARPQFSAITVDARTGQILYSDQPDGLRHPASLTKMMTLYLLFEDLKARKITRETSLRISARDTTMAPSKLGVQAGTTITVDEAIKALVTKSANDVAAAIAENLGGTESAFAARMTQEAHDIGMSHTTFRNASGLPNPGQYTTARDMATLGLRLMRDFPQYYPYFRTTSFLFHGRLINTHNNLVKTYPGTDGIKTGYIANAGFNLVTSTKHGDKRLVGVVLGARSPGARTAFMRNMLEKHFDEAKDGNTIAAMAGSSKGVINPLASDTAATNEPAPAPSPKLNSDGLAAAAANAAAETASTTPASDKPATIDQALLSTWNVQVGTFDIKKLAEDKLASLRARAHKVLDGKTALATPVSANGKGQFAARFAGFDKQSAAKACKALAKLGAACAVIEPAT